MRGLIISGAALVAVTYGLARFGYGLFLPEFTAAFGLTPTLAGAISAGSFAAYCVGAGVAYRLDSFPRVVVACAGASAGVGSLGVAVSQSSALFAASVLVAGAGAGFASPGLVSIIERHVSPARLDSAQTTVNAGTGVGVIAAGLLVSVFAGQWRIAWIIIALVSVAAAVFTLLADSPGNRRARPTTHPAQLSVGLAGMKPLRAPALACLLAGISSAAVWTFGRSQLENAGGMGEAVSSGAWIVLGAAGIAGAASGRLVAYCGIRNAWLLVSSMMGAATVCLGFFPGATAAAYAACAVFGASYLALTGVVIVWSSRVLPANAGAGTALLFIALAVGQAVGAAAFGALLEGLSPATVFGLAGLAAAAGLAPLYRRGKLPSPDITRRAG